MTCCGPRLFATLVRRHYDVCLNYSSRHQMIFDPPRSACLCRWLHLSMQRGAGSNLKTRKEKNAAFVQHWNRENGILYGPKVKGAKKRAQKNKAEEILVLDDDPSVSLNNPSVPTKQKAESKIVDMKKTTKLSHSVTTPAVPASHDSKDMPKLEWILQFPIFAASSDTVPDSTPAFADPEADSIFQGQQFRVSRILEETKSEQSKFVLARWMSKMIEEMGKDGFGKFQSEKMSNASNLHGCIEQYLKGTPEHLLNLSEANQPYWHSLKPVFSNLGEVHSVEVKTDHPVLHYIGIHDCIAVYKNELCLIDWKTSSKPKQSIGDLYDYPLQTAAYVGANNFNPKQDKQVENMLIVVSYEDGSPAHAHFIPRQQTVSFWDQWRHRLHKFWCQRLIPDSTPTSS